MTINVVMASDEAYVMPTCVAMHSAMSTANPGHPFVFHIVTPGGFDICDMPPMHRLLASFPNLAVRQHVVPRRMLDEFERATSDSYLAASTCYRLMIDELLPDVDTCIYMDGDIVVCSDLGELFDQDLHGRALGAVRDPICGLTGDFATRHQELLGFSYDMRYFCAGVLKCDLRRIREGETFERLRRRTPGGFPFGDQDMLNQEFRDDVAFLPLKFDVLARELAGGIIRSCGCYSQDEVAQVENGGTCILHYAGPADKPWDALDLEISRPWEDAARAALDPDEFASIERSFELQRADRSRARLVERCRDAGRVVLYGFNRNGRACADLLARCRVQVAAFADADERKHGAAHGGVPCVDPQEAGLEDAETLVVVCAQTARKEIEKALRARGVETGRIARYFAHDAAYYGSIRDEYVASEVDELRAVLACHASEEDRTLAGLAPEELLGRASDSTVPRVLHDVDVLLRRHIELRRRESDRTGKDEDKRTDSCTHARY